MIFLLFFIIGFNAFSLSGSEKTWLIRSTEKKKRWKLEDSCFQELRTLVDQSKDCSHVTIPPTVPWTDFDRLLAILTHPNPKAAIERLPVRKCLSMLLVANYINSPHILDLATQRLARVALEHFYNPDSPIFKRELNELAKLTVPDLVAALGKVMNEKNGRPLDYTLFRNATIKENAIEIDKEALNICFNRDGSRYAISGTNFLETGKVVSTGDTLKLEPQEKRGAEYAPEIVFNPTGTRIAAGGAAAVYVYNAQDIHQAPTLIFPRLLCPPCTPLAFISSVLLAIGLRDSTISIWDVTTQKCVRLLRGHTGAVTCIAASHNQQHFASGSEDATIRFWNIDKGEYIHLIRHMGTIKSIAFSRDDSKLLGVAASEEYYFLRLWKTVTREEWPAYGETISTPAAAFDPLTGEVIHSGCYTPSLFVSLNGGIRDFSPRIPIAPPSNNCNWRPGTLIMHPTGSHAIITHWKITPGLIAPGKNTSWGWGLVPLRNPILLRRILTLPLSKQLLFHHLFEWKKLGARTTPYTALEHIKKNQEKFASLISELKTLEAEWNEPEKNKFISLVPPELKLPEDTPHDS